MTDEPRRFRRPVSKPAAAFDAYGDPQTDPALVLEAAHASAAALVRHGRAAHDPAVTARLVSLADDMGLDAIALLWAERPARSLPGALWRLYVLREWVRRDALGASLDYDEGRRYAGVADAIAGAATPPGPDELRALVDSILGGVFEGDLAVALERAAAFCRVVAAGRATRDEGRAEWNGSALDVASTEGAVDPWSAEIRSASAVLATADDLTAAARLWREGSLD